MKRRLRSVKTIATMIPVALLCALVLLPAQASQDGAATPPADGTPAANATPGADTGPRFLIRPAEGVDGDYFTVEAEPGSSHELTVVLGNADDEPLSLKTYVSNAIPINNGGFALANEESKPSGATTWIDYPAETFEFKAGEGVERTFTVNVPDDAAPGQYIAGIALETANSRPVEGSELFNQIIRKTIAVFIIVPGEEAPAYSLGEPELMTEGTLSRIVIPVENTGNVLVQPAGELTVQDAAGEQVLTAPVSMGSVYAGMTVPLSVPITTALPEGEYSVSVSLTDEETGATASLDQATIAVTGEAEVAAQFTLEGEVTLAPDETDPDFANVTAEVTNQGEPVANAEVVMEVMRNGEPVESFPLAPSLALPQGTTPVSQRYIPPTGWEPGTWSFVLNLNVTDPSTDASTTVATLDSLPEFTVDE